MPVGSVVGACWCLWQLSCGSGGPLSLFSCSCCCLLPGGGGVWLSLPVFLAHLTVGVGLFVLWENRK